MSAQRTVQQWVALADAAIERTEASFDPYAPKEQQVFEAMKAPTYVLRAQLALQLEENAGRAIEKLEKLLRSNCHGVLSVVPTSDGAGAVISLSFNAPIDGGRTEDMRLIWRETQPWRAAGWRIDFTCFARERCPEDQHTPAMCRVEELGHSEELPWCKYCGLVGAP